jgi:hypothetical protein
MSKKLEIMKLWMLVMEFFELQNEFTKMRIQELGEWMEHDCSCPTCLMSKIEAAWDDDTPTFDDEFKEEWE